MDAILFIVKAIILGIVEGLTEFLPVSSTGHLIIFEDFLKWPNDDFNKMFSVVVQLGAILAVVLLFWPKIWEKLTALCRGEREGRSFFLIWIVGCIPAGILGVALNHFIEDHLFSVPTVIAALFIGAILMWGLERMLADRARKKTLESLTLKDAWVVGLCQCLSLWPGFSRSASTIMGGWASGLTTGLAAEYSFFLAIPVMIGASGLSVVKFNFGSMSVEQGFALVIGFLVSFLVAYLVVKRFMAFLRTHQLKGFAYYRLAIAVVLFVLWRVGWVHA